jgi:aminopeptidase YwaD
MKRFIITLFFISLSWILVAQDIDYARMIIRDLTASDMEGRGYVKGGEKKAALYIKNEFEKMNLRAMQTKKMTTGNYEGKNRPEYFQDFFLKVNTFPGIIKLRFDDNEALIPGVDFLIAPGSSSKELSPLTLYPLNKKNISENIFYEDFKNVCVVLDKTEIYELKKKTDENKKEDEENIYDKVLNNEMKADALMFLEEGKLTWGVSGNVKAYPTIYVLKDKYPKKAEEIELQIDTRVVHKYKTQNVIAYIEGKNQNDEYILIGAHYDHLGRMGENTYFPGANDNASGVAMMLDFAKYYSDPFNQPENNIVFIAFGAEEAGLIGSYYFTENPLFPLEKIKFMINLDMLGTGKDGMMVVNTKSNASAFNTMKRINDQKKYLSVLEKRGESANSDHHFFHQKGVPAFFIYLMDKEYKYYHDVNDTYENLALDGYEGAFRLIRDFMDSLH